MLTLKIMKKKRTSHSEDNQASPPSKTPPPPQPKQSLEEGSSKKKHPTEPSRDQGRAAFLYSGFYDEAGDEKGPTCSVSKPWQGTGSISWVALMLGGGTRTSVIGLGGDKKPGKLICFCPKKPENWQIFSVAVDVAKSPEHKFTTQQFVDAHRNTIWVETELREKLLLEYARRVIELISPDYVIVWPLEFYLRGDVFRSANRILSDGGFQLLPKFVGPRIDEDDDDDPANW